MSCDATHWIPGNAQTVAVGPLRNEQTQAVATGLSLTAHVFADPDDAVGDSLVSWSLPEVGVTAVYRGTKAASDLASALDVAKAATDEPYYHVVIIGTNYRSEALAVLYAYEESSLVPA